MTSGCTYVVDDSSTDSSDSDGGFYTNTAKRFKQTKDILFPTGKVKLMNENENRLNHSPKRKAPSMSAQVDSSDDEIFRDVSTKRGLDEDSTDLDEEVQQVADVMEDAEDSFQSVDIPRDGGLESKRYSSNSVSLYEEESPDDPLALSSLNDSELNRECDDDEVTVKVRLASVVHRIEITRAQHFKVLVQKLADKLNIDSNNVSLEFKNEHLDPYSTLKTVPIGITDIVEAAILSEAVAVAPDDMIELKVQSQARNSQVMISIRPQDEMRVLMDKYADASQLDRSKLSFKFDGEVLEPDDTPASLDLEGGECIDVYIKP